MKIIYVQLTLFILGAYVMTIDKHDDESTRRNIIIITS